MLRENYMYIVCALKILHVLVDVFLIGCLLLVEWCYDWIDFVCIIVSVNDSNTLTSSSPTMFATTHQLYLSTYSGLV